MAEPDSEKFVPGLVEWRVRQLEKRIDEMSLTLATKEDVRRVENSLLAIRESQQDSDDRTFDLKKALWPPVLTGTIIAGLNYLLMHH